MVIPKFAMVRFRRSVMFTNRFSFKKSISKLDTSLPFHIVYFSKYVVFISYFNI